jgi:hypothetical protein
MALEAINPRITLWFRPVRLFHPRCTSQAELPKGLPVARARIVQSGNNDNIERVAHGVISGTMLSLYPTLAKQKNNDFFQAYAVAVWRNTLALRGRKNTVSPTEKRDSWYFSRVNSASINSPE